MTMIASTIIKNANIRGKNRSINTDSGWHFHSYQKKKQKTKTNHYVLHLGKVREERKDRFSLKKKSL
jgi:hypothetical protein